MTESELPLSCEPALTGMKVPLPNFPVILDSVTSAMVDASILSLKTVSHKPNGYKTKRVAYFVPRFTRTDVATPYSTCKICSRPTRSHVLEPAQYEEFTAEVVVNQSDEFATKRWEEVEEVVKARKAADPIVLCHRCWLEKKDELSNIIDSEYDEWMDDTMGSISRIHSIAHSCKYYQFGGEMDDKMKTVVKKVKGIIKGE